MSLLNVVYDVVSYSFKKKDRSPPYAAMTTSKEQARSDVWNMESLRSLLEWKSYHLAQGKLHLNSY